MKKFIPLLICILFSCNLLQNQETSKTKGYTIAFYNVENLFDTEDDPAIDDQEFLPSSEKQWDAVKYNKKLADLSKVISAISPENLPAIVGFAEVENRKVVEDLIIQQDLKKAPYQVVHENSPDGRGIDVALIYRSDLFQYITHSSIPVALPNVSPNDTFKTRDILYVKGLMDKKDTLHIFVNHWPSRTGGETESEPKRMAAALRLRSQVDSLLLINKDSKILIMGDMNDEPQNKSLRQGLQTADTKEALTSEKLYNLMYDKDLQNEGTYNFRGQWNMLDNLVVSSSLINGKRGFVVADATGHIFREEWLMYKNNNGELSPNRTYGGNKYFGGYSDHLPVYTNLVKR